MSARSTSVPRLCNYHEPLTCKRAEAEGEVKEGENIRIQHLNHPLGYLRNIGTQQNELKRVRIDQWLRMVHTTNLMALVTGF